MGTNMGITTTSYGLLMLLLLSCGSSCALSLTRERGPRMRPMVVNRLYSVQLCPNLDEQETGLRLINHTVQHYKNGVETVNADIEFLRTIHEWTSMTIILHRCREAVSFNTCEYYQTWTWPSSMCAISQWKGVMWTPLVESFTPTFKCPFKGYYRGRNMTLDYDQLATLLQTHGMVYKVETRIYEENRQLNVCFQFHTDFKIIKVPA